MQKIPDPRSLPAGRKAFFCAPLKTSLPVLVVCMALILNACAPLPAAASLPTSAAPEAGLPGGLAAEPVNALISGSPEQAPAFTPRPQYSPGELVDYTVQSGDTLVALAARFNTTIPEMRKENPFIPDNTTTLPPGMPMKIPIYYVPLWGTPYQIIPDSLFINGPAQVGFDTAAFIAQYPGWLNGYIGNIYGEPKTGAEIIDQVAKEVSISPRLLLALLEYHAQALSNPTLSPELTDYPLGLTIRGRNGLYRQLSTAVNTLNNGYYSYRRGALTEMVLLNGRIERPDPWQNAATVSLQFFYSQLLPEEAYHQAISSQGFAAVYTALFGDPWDLPSPPHLPGSLVQPEFFLPFEPGTTWAYTGGPHTPWGTGEPLAAIDFAPPSVAGGCEETDEWAVALADGIIARAEPAIIVLDLDGDGDERTGWNIFYLHLAGEGEVAAGTMVKAGQPVGHPSCNGGRSTGTHVHIARKYNGEWILADGPLAFNMEGWIAGNGPTEYLGTLTRHNQTITACTCSDFRSHIRSDRAP